MRAPLYQLDAFATRRFAGNPAAVVVVPDFPDATLMQKIAAENNLSETAFVVPPPSSAGDYALRWFTPKVEVPLCGHATLASAAVVMERLETARRQVTFRTASGPLVVTRSDGGYVLNFPMRNPQPVAPPEALTSALGVTPHEVHDDTFNYLAVLDSARAVRALAPDFAALAALDRSGIVVTAPGDEGYDIVSRYFAPAKGINEDPVTGGAHCALTPFWTKRLRKHELRAWQASPRGGELHCRMAADRVEMEGACVFYLEGHIAF